MKPKIVNLHCYRGQTYKRNFFFTRRRRPIDLTDHVCKAEIRPSENSPKLIQAMTCTVDGERGRVELYISAEDTAKIKPGVYRWDLKMTDDSGEVAYYIAGAFEVTGRVTE